MLRFSLRPRRALALAVALVLLGLLGGRPLQAQSDVLVEAAENRPLPSLRDAILRTQSAPSNATDSGYESPDWSALTNRPKPPAFSGPDPLLGTPTPSLVSGTLEQSFDGADLATNNDLLNRNPAPLDANGDVGANHYMQMVNLVTTIFDKNGSQLDVFPNSAFWDGFGGLCETTNRGEPIVLYDETNDRWIVSQHAFTSAIEEPYYQCIAVSQTNDPTGGYNRYAFDLTGYGFNDNVKLGVTSESITMMADMINGLSFAGTLLAAFDKDAMYAGSSAGIVAQNIGGGQSGFVAGDLDDPFGSAGFVPALFATVSVTANRFEIWEMDVDWSNPGSAAASRIAQVPISSFDSDLCTAALERCIEQPAPGDTTPLSAESGRLMHGLQIRDFGGYRTMVAAQTVDADGTGRAGIRWYELRETGGAWSLHQEGTYAPDDGLHRWIPSIAMNAAGDIGIGYMVGNASTYPSIRLTGQTAGSSGTGAMNVEELNCVVGTGAQTGSNTSGTYSSMSVDPASDNFWHTNQYVASPGGEFNWSSRICEFKVGDGTANLPPFVSISAPADNADFTEGENISFSGTASDPEDGDLTASLAWSSNVDGAIGSGGSFSKSDLSVGTHTITASVTDGGGNTGADSITIDVNEDQTPSVSIVSPSAPVSVVEGDPITFNATATDPEDGDLTASISWTSSLDGAIGTGGSFSKSDLSVGMHLVVASVTDSGSNTGSDSINVEVQAAIPPPQTDTLTVLSGWNLLGLPLDAPNAHHQAVFDDQAASQAYAYTTTSGYVARDSLRNGEGFWILFDAETTIVSSGERLQSVEIEVGEGWNLISGPGCAMPVSDVTSSPPGLVESDYYGYGAGGYSAESTTLERWKGYWVLLGAAGVLSMTCP